MNKIKIDISGLTELEAVDRINNKLTVIGFNTSKTYILLVPERLNLEKFTVKVEHNLKLDKFAIVKFKEKGSGL